MEPRNVPFSDLLANVIDNRGKTCPTSETGIPLIATNCIRNESLYPIHEKVRYVSEVTFRTWFRGHPKPGDLIFVTKGTPGRVCIAPDPVSFCIAQDMVAVRADETKVDPKYLFALLRSERVQQRIQQMHVGTLIPHFKKGDFDKLLLPIPDRPLQVAIGDLYFQLSRKIELNFRTNETLEEIERSIFKSWFVDFDPVHAKAEGRQPIDMDLATGALFSDSFQDSPLGPIPNGWRVSTLGAEAQRCGGCIQTGPFGSQLHASDYVSAPGVPVVMPKNITNRRVSTADIARITEFDAERLSRHRLKAGDIVYSRRGDVERHAWITNNEVGWLCGTGCLLVRMGPKWPAPIFISFTLDRPESRAWISQRAIGATMPNLNTTILSDFPLAIPPDGILAALGDVMGPIELLISANNAESHTLADLRDTLLPKLISGRVPMREPAQIAEASRA